MGLDMYLEGNFWVGYDNKNLSYEGREAKKQEVLDMLQKSMPGSIPDGCQLYDMHVRIGYWRKANAIHAWFVDNCQDGVDECQKTQISLEQIKELKRECKEALKGAKDKLVPRSGFFFGSTERDEWYEQDLQDTIEICNRTIKFMEQHGFWAEVTYQSSW